MSVTDSNSINVITPTVVGEAVHRQKCTRPSNKNKLINILMSDLCQVIKSSKNH